MSVPDKFYLYLVRHGYTNACMGSDTDGHGSYVVPTVQVDSVQLKTNEMYFHISYPLIKLQFDPHGQGVAYGGLIKRNPTATIDKIFKATGGDKVFKKNYEYYTQGTYDANAKVIGNDSIFSKNAPERYVTDTEMNSAFQHNMWVNESGVFKMDDIPIPKTTVPAVGLNYGPSIPADVLSKSFTNYLIGCLIKGEGYENIEFPMNGHISSMLKDAGIVEDAVSEFYKLNKGKKSELQTFSGQISGDSPGNNPYAIIFKGIAHPETLIGSAFITVSQYNEKEILVKVFDIKSIYSGDYGKETKKIGVDSGLPISLVRNSTNNDNRYTNTSQTYSFTLSIDFKRLEKDK